MDELILKRSFSKAAGSYDNFAYLQKEIGLNLIARLPILENKVNILDIGSGTGWLADYLSKNYKLAKIFGIDFAQGMVSFAKKNNPNCNFIASNALTLPFKDKYFDLVISNATYQLISDYNKAFSEVKRILMQKGNFYFTCFGDKTLFELRQVIQEEKNNLNSFYRLPTKEKIISALINNGFKKIKIKISQRKEYFEKAFDLVKWLKSIGVNKLTKPEFFTKYTWEKINNAYSNNFSDKGKVFATFEIFEVGCS